MMVDTGAENTLVVQEIFSSDIPASAKMCEVIGHCVQLRVPKKAQLDVGGQEVQLSVYVADLEEDCLLGADYLLQTKVYTEFVKMILMTAVVEVPGDGDWLLVNQD